MALENFFTEDQELAGGGTTPTAGAGEDLFDLPAEPRAESQASPAAAKVNAGGARARGEKSAPVTRAYPPFDPDLDEDIFHFDDSLLATSKSKATYISKAELLAPEPESEPERAKTPTTREPETVREVAEALLAPPVVNASPVVPALAAATPAAGFFSGRTTQVALAAILVVNAAFVFFAWQASDGFRDALRDARGELTGQHVETVEPAPAPRHEIAGPEVIPPHAIDDWVASLESPVEITFKIAEREIADGQWASARRRLYALLATQDRNDVPRERLADAQYWIAEAWSRESAAIASREAGR